LEDLAILKHMIKSEEYKIEEININFEESIKDKIKEKNSAQAPILNRIEQFKKSYDEMFREICDNAKFEKDRFLKAAKIKGDSYKEGRYRIIRHIKTERKLNQAEFKNKYPEEFIKIAEVGLTKADSEIGKNRVNQLCTINEKYSFEFYDPDDHKEE
jgi:hypothetical protein